MQNLNPDTIMFALGIGGVIFSIYSYFRNPQINLEKSDSLLELTLKNLQTDLINLRDNHVHTLQTSINNTNDNLGKLALEVTRLATIIDERIPRKQQ